MEARFAGVKKWMYLPKYENDNVFDINCQIVEVTLDGYGGYTYQTLVIPGREKEPLQELPEEFYDTKEEVVPGTIKRYKKKIEYGKVNLEYLDKCKRDVEFLIKLYEITVNKLEDLK